mgnify:FL=1
MAGPFHDAAQRLLEGLKAGMYQAGLDIMYVSEAEVPVDTATLKLSARVQEPIRVGDNIECEIGYGYGSELNPKTGQPASSYAVPVHERLDQFHEPPTKAKFLEDPVYGYASLYEETIATTMRMTAEGTLSYRLDIGPSDAVRHGGGLGGDERRAAIMAAARGISRADVIV